MQRGDTHKRVASNIVVLSIRPQARSGSPRFRWRSGFAETYTRERVCCRQTTGPNYMAHYGSEGWLCRLSDHISTLGGYEPSGGKVQENDEERRHAYACRLEHRCLVYKTPSAERLSALPLAFGLCRNIHAGACMLQANNRPEISFTSSGCNTSSNIYAPSKASARSNRARAAFPRRKGSTSRTRVRWVQARTYR